MRRRTGRNPTVVGLISLVVLSALIYLGFAKDIPFVGQPYEIKAAFRDSSGINPNSPVRIAGVDIGKVTKVEHTTPGAQSATVTMAITDKGRPIHKDAEAKIRPRIFLEGNFFVDLSPGTPSGGEIAEGGTIPDTRTANPVQFDEVLKAFKRDTRQGLSGTLVELGKTYKAGGGKAFNESLRYQAGAFRFSAVVSEALLGERPGDLGDFVRDQGIVSQALDRDPRQLQALITNLNTTFGALADRDDELAATVEELDDTLRAGVPAFADLNAAFPSVREFASAARPGVRSTGPTARATLPLVRELRGLVGPNELRGLSSDLRRAVPPLTSVAVESVPLLEEGRELAGCTADVLVPWGNDRVPDPNFPATGPVFQENSKFLPGLAGESRSFDANGQWFKVQGGGGAETFTLGDGLFGTSTSPIIGVNPPPDRERPPLRPDVPCETQERPNLQTRPQEGPRRVDTRANSPEVRERAAQAKAVAIDEMRRDLLERGDKTRVLDRPITRNEIDAIAARNGLRDQLDKLRAGETGR